MTSEASAPCGSGAMTDKPAGCDVVKREKLALKPTRMEQTVEVGDESGYHFTITVVWDDEWGWQASAALTSFGLKEADGAVEALRAPARHFLRLLDEAGDPAPSHAVGLPLVGRDAPSPSLLKSVSSDAPAPSSREGGDDGR